ncbi:LamG-like jellyroll fold domain-containing protein [Streptomyces sp. NPDC058953]|uniref:LamG domain-containing protein n=1 Tax=Streptomyces sp. NPDC058953 TaxID=3346676 RepID=UPI00369E7113
MTTDQSLLKIYSDRTYTHTTMVRHQGTALAFALDDRRRIVYTVLDLSTHDEKRGELDAAYWSDNPVELPFPDEIVKVGYGVVPTTRLPRVKKGGRAEAGQADELAPEETDRFLSGTARLTAAAPFQVLSDGTHLVVLRQAIGAAHPDAVHTLTGGGVSGDGTRSDYLQVSGAKVPLVADTLLCDRFLLVGGALKPVTEVRFKRSRHRTRPASAKDSLGAKDMDGKPFHEPTQELAFIRNLTEGRFTAVLTPTAVQGQRRWQFFTYNNTTKRIDSFNVEQGTDGLFNTQGTRFWTSPKKEYRGSVYERSPGVCPFSGEALVPVVPENRLAETALQLNQSGGTAYVNLGTDAKLKFNGQSYTVEAWVKPQTAGGPVLSRWAGSGQGGFQLRITNTGQVALDHSGGTLTATQTVTAGAYAHVAASFNGTTATLYVNGAFSGSAALAYPTDGTAGLRIGSAQSGAGFSGGIDEVRIWNRARTQAEISDERGFRLIGNEPGLIAYYRLDEGSGTTVYDQTDTAVHGTVTGTTALWVTSEAPISDHPGVRRDSFTVAGRDVVSGLSAVLYYQQEDVDSGYEASARPAKRQARVVLAFSTRPTGNATAEAHIATVDLGVGVDGRLAGVPDVLTLTELGRPEEESGDLIRQKDEQVKRLRQEYSTLVGDAAARTAASQAGLGTSYDPTKSVVALRIESNDYFLSYVSTGGQERLAQHYEDQAGVVARWRLAPVPGGAARYGNQSYALVSLAEGNPVVVAAGSGQQVTLARLPVDASLPANARWYLKGGLTSSVQIQSVHNDLWLGIGTQVAEAQAPTFLLDAVSANTTMQIWYYLIGALGRDRRVLQAKLVQIAQAEEELARASNGLQGAADLTLSVPHLAIDPSGLSVAGAVLKFARTSTAPSLVDSSTGRVILYFKGDNSQFFAAYLDTAAVRGTQQLAAGGVTAVFTARDPGVDLTGTTITVANSVVNGVAMDELCTLTITRGTDRETFAQLPRKAKDLAAAVNGTSEEPVQLGSVTQVSDTEIRLGRPLALAVPKQSYARIDDRTYLVTAQAVESATSLRVFPAPPAAVVSKTVSLVRYDVDSASASRPGTTLAEGSRWITVSADKGDVLVPNGTATAQITGHGSRWRADAPGRSFLFSGGRMTLPADRLDQVTVPGGDLTLEAWVKPETPYITNPRVLHVHRGTTKAALALIKGPAKTGGMILDGINDAMLIEGADPTGTDFTIECWLKRTTGRTVPDTILAIGANGLSMGFTADGKFSFCCGPTTQTLTTADVYSDDQWHHWAATFHRTTKVQTIVRDGIEVARGFATTLPSGTGGLIVGRSDSGTIRHFAGQLAELRTWSRVRTTAEIDTERWQRLASSASGLTGAWVYETAATTDGARRFTDLSAQNRTGGVWGNPVTTESPLAEYRVAAAVGDKVRQSRDLYRFGDWAHLAAVYEQSWALRFEGAAWAETPDDDALDITEDLTIEVFATIDAIGTRQGLVSKGALGSGEDGTVPYQLAVNADGKLEFAFEEPGSAIKRYTSTSPITAGFRRIAVVRKGGSTTEESKTPKQITYTDADKVQRTMTVDVVDKVTAKKWDDIRFVVDGTEIGVIRYNGPGPRGNNGPLTIGRVAEGTAANLLTGTVGEVRIWNTARDGQELGQPLQPRDEGLIARWTFEENEGNTTADLAGGHDLKLRGARWTRDPDPRAGSFLIYRNGQTVACDTPTANPLSYWGDEQLTLGNFHGTFASDSTGSFGSSHAASYKGVLEEVRFWRTARTREQILDNLFTRLRGDKQDLVGYWPFDGESTYFNTENLRDLSLRGNHLNNDSNDVVLSTAPISTDTAMVRPALAGLRTPFHQLIAASPTATEYADLQYTADGEARGVLKRAYAHITGGAWHLTTGYKVGDLISEWVSQVQFDPQLIGYIEGAPPVPSENLTGDSDPSGTAEVTFKQSEEVTSTLSSSRERSVDAAFSFAAGVEVDAQLLLITAPLGIGTAQPAADIALQARVGGSLEYSNAWTDETAVSQGSSIARDTTASLTCSREALNAYLNSNTGRRYVPANKGYALVQSETADVYALRLAHSGALVAYRIMPNPDIPKDWNIITFPINPQYTKQGTLDGAVGLTATGAKVFDTAYPNAGQRAEYSYFKPREAYAIKRRILRERQELENFYNSVSTETHDPDPTAERASKLLESFVGSAPADAAKKQPTESAGSFANRNIVNTYVWTADGGFFSETTGTTDVVTQTTGGSYSFSGAGTFSMETSFEVAGIGVGLQFDASLGGGMTVTRQRSTEATRSHSLEVTCNLSRDIQKYVDGKAQYDAANKPVLTVGKVDAYRFMTFYLGQDTGNFDDFYHKVVDPTWLANSTEPHATALRQAQHSDRKPPCWRVLHRVTYLSRVLPAVPSADAPPLDKALRQSSVDVASNYELIRRLDPYVSTAIASRSELADATRTALRTHLPQLLPHQQEITTFLADYYGVDS